MRQTIFILILFITIPSFAQPGFKTIAPQKQIVEGEAFQVQYILEDGKKAGNMKTPYFKGFRFVSGPNIYMGTVSTLHGLRSMHNVAYTLEAVKPGFYIIPGATLLIDGKPVRSNDVQVEVISKERAMKNFDNDNKIINSDYFLKPGEDPYKKIRDNLFVKVQVDKKSCLVGEPVLATFKLYSRLESRSDIVKNPGMYGFTVYDMVNLADNEVKTETFNGKYFDVHTIRKVQLYPLQAGTFIIDPLEVKNRVEFSSSIVNKRTEQEVIEGILENNDHDLVPPGTDVFETNSSTEAITIKVKPVTEKNKPASYSGAVGHFNISSSISKSEFSKNEQGFLELTISGSGNFIQIDAPVVSWPAGIEGFEPGVKDDLNKMNIPLTGSRTFIYRFVAISPGQIELPPVKFSFFDIDSNKYKIIETNAVSFRVSNEEKVNISPAKITSPKHRSYTILLSVSAILVITALFAFLLLKNKKSNEVMTSAVALLVRKDFLFPVREAKADDHQFYSLLHEALWKFATERFGLQGSEMNKQILTGMMNSENIPTGTVLAFNELVEYCETAMFTGATLDLDKNQMIKKAEEIIKEIDQSPEPGPGSEYL